MHERYFEQGGIQLRRRDRLCILDAKTGFPLDRLKTIFKGCQTAISGAAAEICAPLPVFLAAVCLCAVSERVPNNKADDRH